MTQPVSRSAVLGTLLALTSACAGEEGGAPTVPTTPGEAFAAIDDAAKRRFLLGKSLFERLATPDEGLGPLYNEERCSACHDLPAVGGGGTLRVIKATRFEDGRCDPLVRFGGDNIQQRATELLRATGIAGESVPDEATGTAAVTAPPLFGLGLLAAVPDAHLDRLADPDDRNGDGISGRRGRDEAGRPGRFGRRSEVVTLEDFVDTALRFELGLTTPAHPREETVNGRPIPPEADPMAEPEIDERGVAALADYVRFLAPPSPAPLSRPLADSVAVGRELFSAVGCAACHVPSLPVEGGPAGVDRAEAYTDLLLHDLGVGFSDVCGGDASPSEYRTAPLWGLRHRTELLYDGSARSVEEAVSRHGGEADGARARFQALGEGDRVRLLRFLATL